ncbi:MAG: PQQ-binding-like beta-propeller repeat protein [Candidatus Omnitrophota bacterium]
MTRKIRYILISLAVFQWHVFGANPQHTNYSEVNFNSDKLKSYWEFNVSKHIWEYSKRRSVWSISAVEAKIDGNPFIFIGSYINNLYCLDARNGKEVWRFTTGGPINSAPVFCWVGEKPLVVAASADRIVYCLDARTGRKLWSNEVYPWTFTVFEAITTSPIVVDFDKAKRIILGIWYADRRPFKNIQKGELLCLDALTGKVIWRKVVSESSLSSPAFIEIKGQPYVYIGSSDGNLYCISAIDGRFIWKFSLAMPISSSPLIAQVEGKDVVIVGGSLGLVYCIDAQDGTVIWKYRTGLAISSSGAVCKIDGKALLFLPSYDRFLYCIDLSNGERLWRYATKKYISSSPIVVKIEDRLSVIFVSLDNRIYALEAKTGKLFWSYALGKRLWLYETRAETLWPSPIVVSSTDTPLLVVPWYDGKIYAFTSID